VITPGQIVLFRFPQTDLEQGKVRPALVIVRLPGEFDDWLIYMISTQTRHYLTGFDELIEEDDGDFLRSGLKSISVIRTGRLAVVNAGKLLGATGEIDPERLKRIKANLAIWLK
jgi:mRNA interferase MazF